jgi:hypothetical protein
MSTKYYEGPEGAADDIISRYGLPRIAEAECAAAKAKAAACAAGTTPDYGPRTA